MMSSLKSHSAYEVFHGNHQYEPLINWTSISSNSTDFTLEVTSYILSGFNYGDDNTLFSGHKLNRLNRIDIKIYLDLIKPPQ
jgi:hypothetical protein